MKKTVFTLLFLILGWIGFSYAAAAWTREQFIQEVDSFLESPRDLTEAILIPLILNKAQQSGISIRPEDVRVRFASSDRETTTSRMIENKGFKAEVQTLALHIQYGQTVLGLSHLYTLDRERTFTSRITPLSQPLGEQNDLLPE
jgi:hypothetical protein